jgi:predicted transcriptional regulator
MGRLNQEVQSCPPSGSTRFLRPDVRGIAAIIGELEAQVMDVLWAMPPGGGATAQTVFDTLYARNRRIRHGAVVGAMGRMARRGLLKVETGSGAWTYHPTCTQDQLVSSFLRLLRKDLPLRISKMELPAPEIGRDAPPARDFLEDKAGEALRGIVERHLGAAPRR